MNLDEGTVEYICDGEAETASADSRRHIAYAPLSLIITHRPTMIPCFDQLIRLDEQGMSWWAANE